MFAANETTENISKLIVVSRNFVEITVAISPFLLLELRADANVLQCLIILIIIIIIFIIIIVVVIITKEP